MIHIFVRLTQVIRLVDFVDVTTSILGTKPNDAGWSFVLQAQAQQHTNAFNDFELLPTLFLQGVMACVTRVHQTFQLRRDCLRSFFILQVKQLRIEVSPSTVKIKEMQRLMGHLNRHFQDRIVLPLSDQASSQKS